MVVEQSDKKKWRGSLERYIRLNTHVLSIYTMNLPTISLTVCSNTHTPFHPLTFANSWEYHVIQI